jgi:septation ring formation regulator EzrA
MSDQKTVEQLQEELNAANEKLSVQSVAIEKLEETIEELKDAKSALEEEKDSLTSTVNQLGEYNENLQAEVKRLIETPDAKETDNGVGKAFEFEGAKYKVLTPAIRIPGIGRVTANDILANEKAQKWLVENKSGVIAEVK